MELGLYLYSGSIKIELLWSQGYIHSQVIVLQSNHGKRFITNLSISPSYKACEFILSQPLILSSYRIWINRTYSSRGAISN